MEERGPAPGHLSPGSLRDLAPTAEPIRRGLLLLSTVQRCVCPSQQRSLYRRCRCELHQQGRVADDPRKLVTLAVLQQQEFPQSLRRQAVVKPKKSAAPE